MTIHNINLSRASAARPTSLPSERTLRRSQHAALLGSFTIDVASGETRLSQEMIALIGMAEAIVQPDLAVFETMIEAAGGTQTREDVLTSGIFSWARDALTITDPAAGASATMTGATITVHAGSQTLQFKATPLE